jgi:hypothetical protein
MPCVKEGGTIMGWNRSHEESSRDGGQGERKSRDPEMGSIKLSSSAGHETPRI